MSEQKVNKNVVALGVVSFFNDLSSEAVTRLLPLYLLVVLKASVLSVGLVETVSETTAIFAKLFAGFLSDKMANRKNFIFLGYTLSIVSRPFIIFIPNVSTVALARFFEKVGRGVRIAPRDALIADLSDDSNRGIHFGLHRAIDTAGAVISLAAIYFFLRNSTRDETSDLRNILVAASLVGFFALVVLAVFVENLKPRAVSKTHVSLGALDDRLKRYLFVSVFFALANSSDAFLVLRAKDLGLSLASICGLLALNNMVTAWASWKLPKLSDQLGRKHILILGWLIYAATYFVFGLPFLSVFSFVITLVFYGAFYGITDGVEKALVADLESADRIGVAYGWLAVVAGLGVIPANLLFAYLYKAFGVTQAFWSSALFASIGVILLGRFKVASEIKHVVV